DGRTQPAWQLHFLSTLSAASRTLHHAALTAELPFAA
ncbi:hypothetical protein A2U01_0093927, partial [Trifolium medium]|nr:hypothetical protein [Trifolium medium]